jgi:trehalose-6-phosphate synthase
VPKNVTALPVNKRTHHSLVSCYFWRQLKKLREELYRIAERSLEVIRDAEYVSSRGDEIGQLLRGQRAASSIGIDPREVERLCAVDVTETAGYSLIKKSLADLSLSLGSDRRDRCCTVDGRS